MPHNRNIHGSSQTVNPHFASYLPLSLPVCCLFTVDCQIKRRKHRKIIPTKKKKVWCSYGKDSGQQIPQRVWDPWKVFVYLTGSWLLPLSINRHTYRRTKRHTHTCIHTMYISMGLSSLWTAAGETDIAVGKDIYTRPANGSRHQVPTVLYVCTCLQVS